MTPASIPRIFAAIMLLVAAVSAARLVAARRWRRGLLFTDTDVAHVLMGIAMAGMLASSLSTLPNGAWVVIFAVMTAWFAFRVVADARASGLRALAGGRCAPHLMHCGAMVYMFAALAAPAAAGSGMSGMGGASGAPGVATQALRYPTLALVLALILIGYSVWDIDQLSGGRYSTTTSRMPLARAAAFVPVMAGAGPATTTPPGPRALAVAAGDSAPSSSTAASAVAIRPEAGGSAGGGSGTAARGLLLSPAVRVGSRITMGVTMALMMLLTI